MLDGSGQGQRELEQIHSINEGYGINEGYLVAPLVLQTGTPLRGFSKVRVTVVSAKSE